MATLADLQQWRDDLLKARAQGIRSLKDQNGEEIAFSSDREMASAISALDREIAALVAGQPPKSIIFRTSKGL